MKKIIIYVLLLLSIPIIFGIINFGIAFSAKKMVAAGQEKAIKLKLTTPIQVPDTLNVSAQIAEVNADAVKFGLNRVVFVGSIVFEKLPSSQRGRVEWHSIEMTTQGKKTVSEQLTFPLTSQFRTKAELININETIMAKGNIGALEEALQNLALKESKPVEVTTAKDAGTFTAEGGGADSVKGEKGSDDQGSNPFEFQEPEKEEKEQVTIYRQENKFCGKREIDLESMTAYPLFKQITYENGEVMIETNCTPDYDAGVPVQQKVCGYIHDFKTGLSTEQVQYYYTEPLYNNQEINAGECRKTEKKYFQYFTAQGCVDDTSEEGVRVEYTRRAIDTDEDGTVLCDDCTPNATFKTRVDICEDRIIDIQRLQALEQDTTIVTRRNERIPESPFLPFSDSGCELNGNYVELQIEEKGYAHYLSDDPETPGFSRRAVQYYYIEPNQNNKRFSIGDTTEIGSDLEHYITRNTCPVTQTGVYIIPNYRKAFENRFEQEDYATHCYPGTTGPVEVFKEYGNGVDQPRFIHDFNANRSYYNSRTYFIDPVTEEKEYLTPFQRDETYSMAHEFQITGWVHDDEALTSVQQVETYITERDGFTKVKIEESHDHATIPYEFLGETEERLVFRSSQEWTVPGPVSQLKEIILVGEGGSSSDFSWSGVGITIPTGCGRDGDQPCRAVRYTWSAPIGGSKGQFKTIAGPLAVIPGSKLNLTIGVNSITTMSRNSTYTANYNVVAPAVARITGNFNGSDTSYSASPGAIGGGGPNGQAGYTLSNDHMGVGAGGSTALPGASSGVYVLLQHQGAFHGRWSIWGWSGDTQTSGSSTGSDGGILIAFETTKYERPDGTFFYVSE